VSGSREPVVNGNAPDEYRLFDTQDCSFNIQVRGVKVSVMMTQKPVRTFFAAFTLLTGMAAAVFTSIVPSAGAAGLQRHVPAGLQQAQSASSQPRIIRVAGDCAAIGQQVAAQQGGTLTKATAAVQNGAPVCIVVVLVPGRDGERPRRVEVAVPAK